MRVNILKEDKQEISFKLFRKLKSKNKKKCYEILTIKKYMKRCLKRNEWQHKWSLLKILMGGKQEIEQKSNNQHEWRPLLVQYTRINKQNYNNSRRRRNKH